jgi:hypothetical protein
MTVVMRTSKLNEHILHGRREAVPMLQRSINLVAETGGIPV